MRVFFITESMSLLPRCCSFETCTSTGTSGTAAYSKKYGVATSSGWLECYILKQDLEFSKLLSQKWKFGCRGFNCSKFFSSTTAVAVRLIWLCL